LRTAKRSGLLITKKNLSRVISLVSKEVKKYKEPAIERFNRNVSDPFWVLIGCILSLRTKDETTGRVVSALYTAAPTPGKILRLPLKKLTKILYPTGFYRVKTKNVVNISRLIIKKYGGRVPSTIDELLTLPGVGRKTANLVVTVAFNKYGICVDTHVHKIFNRWGFLRTKSADETEFELRKTLPKKYWKKINYRLVTFGQNVCLSVSPWCSRCPVEGYCPKVRVGKRR
jgi:endonuclease III